MRVSLLPLILVGGSLLIGGCGGGGSSPASPSTTVTVTAAPTLGWSLTPDSGTRLVASNPNVAVLNGQVVMFASSSATPLQSSDGLSFAPMAPVANGFPGGLNSASVVGLPGGGFRLYYLTGQSNSLSTAISTDGVHWTLGPTFGSSSGGSTDLVQVVAVPSGGFRAYFNILPGAQGAGSIGSAFSNDGLVFTDEGTRLSGAQNKNWSDATVVNLGSAGWLMFVTQVGATDNLYSQIYLATSPDGLTWTADTGPILASGGATSFYHPSAVVTGAGAARVYYGAQAGVWTVAAHGASKPISSAVVKR